MTSTNDTTPARIDDRVLLLFAGIAGALFGVGAILLAQGEFASAAAPLAIFAISLNWVRAARNRVASTATT